ncbi:hypothetical protein E2C01_031484 [Portunus trituberculatus]|uniref:Uncharacterized protein n=1 Tax=Portunus trituberculatus TaxID=210409 RepID=A0A5B7EY94_PORTR|nr:hypothetical protein [Portunus trituberculatus]
MASTSTTGGTGGGKDNGDGRKDKSGKKEEEFYILLQPIFSPVHLQDVCHESVFLYHFPEYFCSFSTPTLSRHDTPRKTGSGTLRKATVRMDELLKCEVMLDPSISAMALKKTQRDPSGRHY